MIVVVYAEVRVEYRQATELTGHSPPQPSRVKPVTHRGERCHISKLWWDLGTSKVVGIYKAHVITISSLHGRHLTELVVAGVVVSVVAVAAAAAAAAVAAAAAAIVVSVVARLHT